MTTKATFFINQIRRAAWDASTSKATGVAGYDGCTESFYTDTEFNSQAQYDLCKTYMQKRSPMLPANATIVAFRIKDESAKGKAVLYRDPVVGSNPGEADIKEACLKYTFHSTTTASERVVQVAMIPDDLLRGGVFVQYPNWTDWVLAWHNHIRDNWKIKIIDQTVPAIAIDTIDANGNVVLLQPSDIIGTSVVQILRSKTEENNTGSGVFKLKGWTDNKHFQVKDWTFGATSGGEARRFVQTYNNVIMYQQQRLHPAVGKRNIGRPFDQSRGKASTRR